MASLYLCHLAYKDAQPGRKLRCATKLGRLETFVKLATLRIRAPKHRNFGQEEFVYE
jgi:hypothetical protein